MHLCSTGRQAWAPRGSAWQSSAAHCDAPQGLRAGEDVVQHAHWHMPAGRRPVSPRGRPAHGGLASHNGAPLEGRDAVLEPGRVLAGGQHMLHATPSASRCMQLAGGAERLAQHLPGNCCSARSTRQGRKNRRGTSVCGSRLVSPAPSQRAPWPAAERGPSRRLAARTRWRSHPSPTAPSTGRPAQALSAGDQAELSAARADRALLWASRSKHVLGALASRMHQAQNA